MTGAGSRILVATDAWHPQVNGVVRTYERLVTEAARLGAEIVLLTPDGLRSVPLPTYPEIRLALASKGVVARRIEALAPRHIHVATEGPIGLRARAYALSRGRAFTTCYHTRLPDYLSARLPVPRRWSFALQRWFHNAGVGMLVSTPSMRAELHDRGFRNIRPWTRGVDTELFRPRADRLFGDGPIFLYVGRVAVEKNIEAFLSLALPGRKVVVGGGPALDDLRNRHADVVFTGTKTGEDLARAYASADVFVFPSRTDTFGMVLLEAMASGLPVAAYPVTGPLDVVTDGGSGALDDDLGRAATRALTLSRADARAQALQYSWQACARQFVDAIAQASNTARP